MKTNLENYEKRFVDYMEGQLDTAEMKEVEAFVAQHPELEEDFKLFCSAKLEPDTSVVFTKKETLMQPTTVIRPLYVRIAVAAACVALLIGIGVRFLKPHHELVQQPLLASLTPIEAQPIGISQDNLGLRKSDVRTVSIQNAVPQTETIETMASFDKNETDDSRPIGEPFEITAMNPIVIERLAWNGGVTVNDIERKMFTELGERLVALEPYDYPNSPIEDLLVEKKEQAIASLQGNLFDNVRQTTRTLYKRTAKVVMDVYYTADGRLDEAKELLASR